MKNQQFTKPFTVQLMFRRQFIDLPRFETSSSAADQP